VLGRGQDLGPVTAEPIASIGISRRDRIGPAVRTPKRVALALAGAAFLVEAFE